MPALVCTHATTGPPAVLTRLALSASPAGLTATAPIATHPPAPPLAVGSNRAARISLDPVAVNSLHATIGLPLPSIAMLGRRELVAVLLMPPPCALPARNCQTAPVVTRAT